MKNAINEYMRLYLQFRKAEGLAVSTLKGYEYHVKDLMKHIPEGSDDIRAACLEYLSQEGIAPNTYNYRRKYLKCFFDWCISEGYLTCEHPLKGLKKRRGTDRIVNIDDGIIAQMLRLPDKTTFAGLRDYALMLLSVDCGLRPNEALNLRESDFDFGLSVVTIPAAVAKTRQSRTLPISEQTISAVRALLSVHSPDWTNNHVFCNNRGARLGVNSWSRKISKYGKRLDVHISAYHLRHIAALAMLRAGMNVFCLRDMLGHSDLSVTQKYLSLQLDDLRREHSKASLLNIIAPITQEEQPRVRQFSRRVMKISPPK